MQLNDCWKYRILVIGATNILENIDPAVLRAGRMDKKIFIGPPDLEAPVELIKLYMEDRPQNQIDWLELGEKTEFFTSAELGHAMNEAAKMALEERRPITFEDISGAVSENPPNLNKDRIEKMKSPIGFIH